MDRTESDSPHRELSNGGLESVVILLVRWQINYLCASPGKAIQLYTNLHDMIHIAYLVGQRFTAAIVSCVC